MKKYTVQVEQIRHGYVTIEAENMEEALKITEMRFNREGEELPEMDDCKALDFTVVEAACLVCFNNYNPEKLCGSNICFKCMTQIQKYTDSRGDFLLSEK